MEDIKDVEVAAEPAVADSSAPVEVPAEEVTEVSVEAPVAPEAPVDQGEIGG